MSAVAILSLGGHLAVAQPLRPVKEGALKFQGAVNGLVPCRDGTVLAWGSFSHVGGVPYRGIVRLTSNGAVDPAFLPNSGAPSLVQDVVEESDGRILVAHVGSTSFLRLNTDGSLVSGGTGASTSWIVSLGAQSDGHVSGSDTSISAEAAPYSCTAIGPTVRWINLRSWALVRMTRSTTSNSMHRIAC